MSSSPLRSRLLTLAAVAAVSLTAAACGGNGAISAPGPRVGQRADAPLAPAVTNAPLVDTTGRRFSLGEFSGKIVVLSDVMTLCQETCPLDTANVVAAARAAQKSGLGDKIEFVSLTIDPTRDTLTQLRAYRRLYAPAPADWVVATGGTQAVAALWKSLGVYIEKVPDSGPNPPRNWRTGQPLTYDLTHSDEVFFLDHQDHERFILEGAPHVAKGAPIPATIEKFMDASGRHNITHPSRQAWTEPQELQVLSWLTQHRLSAA